MFFYRGKTSDEIFCAYLRLWVVPYVGYSQSTNIDQGPQFTSDKWKSLFLHAGIQDEELGKESQNILVAGERYHSFLREIYQKFKAQHAGMSGDDALRFSMKAMN